ncbi:MAG TPA: type II secretion system protein GspL [Burkholderiaceae bacterium]|jgi:general secretion pathway protein L
MTTLILLLPPRARLRAHGRDAVTPSSPELDWVLTDGRHVSAQGRATPQTLPDATQVVAVLADEDVAWRRVELPRAGRQMRQALAGMLEEKLLDDTEQMHFALESQATGGESAWVALCSRPWLSRQLTALEEAGVPVDRVAPLSWPGAASIGHFEEDRLHWSSGEGVNTLNLEGALTRQLITPSVVETGAWSATPASAARAEEWLGAKVEARTREQRALTALASDWNLRQFDLTPRTRGLQQLRRLWSEFMMPAWRPVRWGLIGLVALNLLGLNVMAWKQQQQLKTQRAAMSSVLTQAYPSVRAVLDAPQQMRRETEALRAAAGQPGRNDLETLLAAAAAAWPAELGPVENFSYESGRLTLASSGWTGAQVEQFGNRLRSDGWQLASADGRMVISPLDLSGRTQP